MIRNVVLVVAVVSWTLGCGEGPTSAQVEEGSDTAWTYPKDRFIGEWTVRVSRGGAVVSRGVVSPEVRQEEVVFYDAERCTSSTGTVSWCAEHADVSEAAVVVPLEAHVDPRGASAVACDGGEGLGCRDTAELWYERDLMVWTDELGAHEVGVAARVCGGVEVVSYGRDASGDVLTWGVVCVGSGEVLEVVLEREVEG